MLIPPIPLSKGAIRACGLSIAVGLSLPASFGPASYDALFILRSVLFRYVMQLGRTLTLRAAFASSTYLLPQIPGPLVSIPLTPFPRGHIRPLSAPERMATASLFFGRHLRMPW